VSEQHLDALAVAARLISNGRIADIRSRVLKIMAGAQSAM
jgi:hypothetical protein